MNFSPGFIEMSKAIDHEPALVDGSRLINTGITATGAPADRIVVG
jgi:hypothetical protein